MKHALDKVARIGWLLVAGALISSMTGNWLAAIPPQVGQNSATAMTVQSAGPMAPPVPAMASTPSAKADKVGAGAKPEVPYVPVGSGFTYQGSLKSGGNPANGSYDFALTLYDALTGGNLVGAPITQTNVTVTGGLFTVPLDFGSSAFDGNARYLEIAVRQTGGGSYTTLSPRQPITPAPYALFALKTQPYKNVVTVAQSGGQYTSITAALNSITDASSTNHYLVWVEPGVYAETVTMKQWVDIEGAGEQSTKITFTGSGNFNSGTVVGASNAELRFLTVENTGGQSFATAISNNSASPSLLHVTATASGGTNTYGVLNDASSPNMSNVTATASGGSGSDNLGVYNYNFSSPNMSNVTASASGSSSTNFGVGNDADSSPNMSNVTATASGGSSTNYGVGNDTNSSPTMSNVTASASGGSNNDGVYNSGSLLKIVTSNISASGGSTNYGVYSVNSTVVTIDNTKITVPANANTIFNGSGATTRVGASQLAGGNVANSGTLACAGVYDENYVFYPSTCP